MEVEENFGQSAAYRVVAAADAASRAATSAALEPAVVERRRDERAVAAGIGEPRRDRPGPEHRRRPAASPRNGLAHARDQREVEPDAHADARQIDHDHGADAGLGGARGQ